MSRVENDTTQACLELLALRGWFAWRQGSQPVYDPARKSFRKKPKGSINGVSDIIALEPHGRGWFIEVKNPDIGKDHRKGALNKAQRDFRVGVTGAGHRFLTVYSLDDLIEALSLNEIMRTPRKPTGSHANGPISSDSIAGRDNRQAWDGT